MPLLLRKSLCLRFIFPSNSPDLFFQVNVTTPDTYNRPKGEWWRGKRVNKHRYLLLIIYANFPNEVPQ